MPTKKKKVLEPFRSIEFVNMPEKDSGAFIACKVNGQISTEQWKDNYSIVITDCDSRVCLHGSLSNPKSRTNGLNKINQLIHSLTEMRNHIEAQMDKLSVRYDKKLIE